MYREKHNTEFKLDNNVFSSIISGISLQINEYINGSCESSEMIRRTRIDRTH